MGPGDRVKAAKRMLGITYRQEGGKNATYLRTSNGKTPYRYMDCSEFVCRVLAADGITSKVEYMTTGTLRTYFSNEKRFIHSDKPQVGDIALFVGHVGIVGAVRSTDGNIKLIHETHPNDESKENPYFTTTDKMDPGAEFLGYYRPVTETPDGKDLSSMDEDNQIDTQDDENPPAKPSTGKPVYQNNIDYANDFLENLKMLIIEFKRMDDKMDRDINRQKKKQ